MSVLADTHALHWFLADPGRLSRTAFDRMHEAQLEGAPGLVVSVASRVDLHYLVASGRLDAALAAQVWAVTTYPDVNVRAAPVTGTIVERFSDAELAALRDPWDRLIVASAIDLGMPLVTKDGVMTDLGAAGVVDVIW